MTDRFKASDKPPEEAPRFTPVTADPRRGRVLRVLAALCVALMLIGLGGAALAVKLFVDAAQLIFSPSQPLQLLLQRGPLFLVPVLLLVSCVRDEEGGEERNELVRLPPFALFRSLSLSPLFSLSSLENQAKKKKKKIHKPLPQLGQALRVRPVVPRLFERKLQPLKLLPLPLQGRLDDLFQLLQLDDRLPLVAKARGQHLLDGALLVELVVVGPLLPRDQGLGPLPGERVGEHGGEGRVGGEERVGGDDAGWVAGRGGRRRGRRPRGGGGAGRRPRLR